MSYKKKYKKGTKIKSLAGLLVALDMDGFVYHRKKILHKSWVISFQFRYVIGCIKGGQFRRAIKIEEEK